MIALLAFIVCALLIFGLWVAWIVLQVMFYAVGLLISALYLTIRAIARRQPPMPRSLFPQTDLRQAYRSDRR